jgi:hypothetical protein
MRKKKIIIAMPYHFRAQIPHRPPGHDYYDTVGHEKYIFIVGRDGVTGVHLAACRTSLPRWKH